MKKTVIPKVKDQQLTANEARVGLNDEKIKVIRFVNTENRQSIVHSHPYYELILNLSGSCVRYSASGRLYDLDPGELIMIPQEVFHSATFNVTMDYSERLILQIDAELWKQAGQMIHMEESWKEEILILDMAAVVKWNLMGLFERMILSSQLQDEARRNVLFCHLVELMTLISQAVKEKSTVEAVDHNLLVAQAVSILQASYNDPSFNTAQLAETCFTSREHLSRTFKKYTMESIHSYLTSLRMQHFRRCLAQGMSITDSYTESGFSDYTSFLKTFRKLYGITPSEYRKKLIQHKKEEDAHTGADPITFPIEQS